LNFFGTPFEIWLFDKDPVYDSVNNEMGWFCFLDLVQLGLVGMVL
jgi:hypothetical protein